MYQHNHYYVRTDKMQKRYGFWKFFWDVTMVVITGGLWLIWIFVREMRGKR